MTIEFDIDMVNHRKYEDITSIVIGEIGNDSIALALYEYDMKPVVTIKHITPRILATLKIKE